LLIYQHLNYGNKFYNFWKWKMGALIKIKCKRKMMIFHAPCTHNWHGLPRKMMMLNHRTIISAMYMFMEESAKNFKTSIHH
jgi:hypothetical protein